MSNNADQIPLIPSAVAPYYGTETVTFDEPAPITAEALPLATNEADSRTFPRFRDVPFALLFLLDLAVILWLGIKIAPLGMKSINFNLSFIENEMRKDPNVTEAQIELVEKVAEDAIKYAKVYFRRIMLYILLPTCYAPFFIFLFTAAFVVRPCPRVIAYTTLLLSAGFTCVTFLLSSGSPALLVCSTLVTFAVLYYVHLAWKMVPFTAVNLKVALTGMSQNVGAFIVAVVFAEIGVLWFLFWLYTLIGAFAYTTRECQIAHPYANFDVSSPDFDDVCDPNEGFLVFMLLSFLWTSTVTMVNTGSGHFLYDTRSLLYISLTLRLSCIIGQNIIQVTVAGVMATWCFEKKEASSCCSRAIFASLCRSLTFSFGSICLGSLFQSLVSVLRFLVERATDYRKSDESTDCETFFFCILDCCAKLVEDLLDYFNQWAYVFVGIYGFSYIESGRRVTQLFRIRGWTSIITDKLVGYVLAFVTLFVAVINGLFAVLVDHLVSSSQVSTDEQSFVFGPLPHWRFFAFGIGFSLGMWVASIMMNVVKGAVNTLIVCWADSPASFANQHPSLTQELTKSWASTFPQANLQIQTTYSVLDV